MVAFASLKLESVVAACPLLSLCWRINVENSECIEDVFGVLTGDLAEEKHGGGETQKTHELCTC